MTNLRVYLLPSKQIINKTVIDSCNYKLKCLPSLGCAKFSSNFWLTVKIMYLLFFKCQGNTQSVLRTFPCMFLVVSLTKYAIDFVLAFVFSMIPSPPSSEYVLISSKIQTHLWIELWIVNCINWNLLGVVTMTELLIFNSQ